MSMEAEYDFSQGKRGAIDPTSPGKTRITIRLDEEVLAWFREQAHGAGGGNYQTMINEAFRCTKTPQADWLGLKGYLRPVRWSLCSLFGVEAVAPKL